MKIDRMTKGEWGKIKAFFDLKTEEGFVIKGMKIIEGINGLFIGMPSQKGKDDEYFDVVFADRDLREEVSQLALDHYGQEVMPTQEATSQSLTQEDDSNIDMGSASPAEEKMATFVDDDETDDDIPF